MKRPNKKKHTGLIKKVIPLQDREQNNSKLITAKMQQSWLFQLYGINSKKAA
jgi:hypothetical protein